MAKTWLSVITALILVVVSVSLHLARRVMLGSADQGTARGAGVWKVTLTASGELAAGADSVVTPGPPDFRHQHIFDEKFEGQGLMPPRGKKHPPRNIRWRSIPLGEHQEFHLTYSFHCLMGMHRPNTAMIRQTHEIDAPPLKEDFLKAGPQIEVNHQEIADKAASLLHDSMTPESQVRAFFDFVDHLDNQPGSRTALECLRDGRGDSAAKSRLLVALCRTRAIPSRMVSGLILGNNQDISLHHWAEAWVNNHWLPMCVTFHFFGLRHLPKNYLVLRVGEKDLFHGEGVPFQAGFHAEELNSFHKGDDEPLSAVRAFWEKVSLYSLRPGEQHVVKFLLLLPLAALVVSIYRTLIGVPTFGTFSPALVGLAFLDLKALPWGLSIFVGTVLVGWALRRLLDRYHLLLVPRTSVLLTLIVLFLIGIIMVAGRYGVATTQYISLFPLVILTHLVERFWTVESEDGTAASFKTLLGTVVVAITISVVLSPEAVTAWMFRYPETLGVVLALQFLIGRYTGYRLTELYRFHDLIQDPPPPGGTA